MGNVFVSLLLDFWFGSGVMGVRVIGIIELIEQFFFIMISYFQCQIVCIFYVLFFGDKNQFCIISMYCCMVFLVYVVGYQ